MEKNCSCVAEYRSHRMVVGCLLAALIIVFSGFVLTGCGVGIDKKAAHSGYRADENYGKGDYIYSTVIFTGAGLGKEKIMTVNELEKLAENSDLLLGFQNEYSMCDRRGKFHIQGYTGIKLYDLLLYLGMDKNIPDSTEVTLYGKTGKKFVLTVGDIKSHDRSRYLKKTDPSYDETDLAAILAYGSESTPLVGPVGADPDGKKFTEKDGFIKEKGNDGGPVRFIIGQESVDDVNCDLCGKNIKRVVVGEDTDYTSHRNASDSENRRLGVKVYLGNSLYAQKSFSIGDIEAFAAKSDKNKAGGYYDYAGYYEGADLRELLKTQMNVKYSVGTVLFRNQDSTAEILDLSYVMNSSGNYRAYVTDRNGYTLTGVRPAIGFALNGKPVDESRMTALLPKCLHKKPEAAVKPCDEIEVHMVSMGSGAVANYRLNINGSGISAPKSFSVVELSSRAFKDIEMIDGYYDGVSLAGLLEKTGLENDAKSVTVSNSKESVTYDVDDILDYKVDAVIATKYRHSQISAKKGPVVFRGEKNLDNVTSVYVKAENDEWTHFKKPYTKYLKVRIKLHGKSVKSRVYTLKDLELLGYRYTVKAEYTASRKSKDAYQGVILRKLIEDNLKEGVRYPKRVSVIDYSGYEVEVSVRDIFKGIQSKKQPKEMRDIVLAYSKNGKPLVPAQKSEGFVKDNVGGPLSLIVENQGPKWMYFVTEVKVD